MVGEPRLYGQSASYEKTYIRFQFQFSQHGFPCACMIGSINQDLPVYLPWETFRCQLGPSPGLLVRQS